MDASPGLRLASNVSNHPNGPTWPDLAIIGYVKTEVKIAELKDNLSSYLRLVRQGNEVIIKDRDTPIAHILKYEVRRPRLVIRPARGSLKDLKLPPPPLVPIDIQADLQWVRADRF